MKNKNQILIGAGILAVVLYIYRGKIFGKKNTPSESNSSTKPSVKPSEPSQNTNVVAPPKSRQTQDEKECMFQYISMPKPKVVMSDEYWAKHKENFIKDCVARKNRLK